MSKARSLYWRRPGFKQASLPAVFRRRRLRLQLEQLEDRTLPSAHDSIASAIGVTFADTSTSYQTAQISEDLAKPSAVVFNRIDLNAGDVVAVQVNTASFGGGFNSFLRIFAQNSDGSLRQIASNDNRQGLDAGLTFQAQTAGVYFVGVSSFDNSAYNPLTTGSGAGSSSGPFNLSISKSTAPLSANVTVASFQVSKPLAECGDYVTVNYSIQNRGGLAAGPTTTSLVLSADNQFDVIPQLLGSATIPAMAAGASYTGSFTVQLGNSGGAPSPFSASEQLFLGLQLGALNPASPEQGNDWAPVQMLQSETIAANQSHATRSTAASIDLNSRTNYVTLAAGAENFYQIAVTASGNLNAQIDSTEGPVSLTLYDAQGSPIIESDGQSASNPDPLIIQDLVGGAAGAGTFYYLKVVNRGEQAESYNLTTLFTPSSTAPLTIPEAAGSAVIVSGDFNGDGRLDLATAAVGATSVTVLLGNGDGTFRSAGSFDTGIAIHSIVAGDFTGDGRFDLAVSGPEAAGVAILLGNGDGAFQSLPPLSVRGGSSMVAGDFNGDGHLDLAVANPGEYGTGVSVPGTVTVLLGDGRGGFQSESPIVLPGGPVALAVGDFNEDGRLDLAVADETSNQVAMLLGNGDGTFQSGASVAAGTDPIAIVAGDFNGDNHLDVAVADYQSNQVTILSGNGRGSFSTERSYAVGNKPVNLESADFNGDGRLDLVAVNRFSNSATVLFGQEDGRFQTTGAIPTGSFPCALSPGDFNGDGRVDLIVASSANQQLEVCFGNGDGTFMQAEAPNTTGQNPDAMATGDFNGDGRLDIAVSNKNSNDVTILQSQGDGTFAKAATVAVGTDSVALAVGDFNGDGRLDFAVANYISNDLSVLLGNGDGTLQPAETIQLPGRPAAIAVGDFNGDRQPDLAVAIKFNSDTSIGSSVVVLLGRGDGTFQNGISFATGTEPNALVAADFNGDGHVDLATANEHSNDVTILAGDGHGNFQSPISYPVGTPAVALVAGDFNGDTHMDLAVASQSYNCNTATVFLEDNQGTLQNASSVTLNTDIKAMVAGDFNGDGHLDIATVDGRYLSYPYGLSNNISILLGNGQGNLQNASASPVGSQPTALVAGDFNGDNHLDLVVANGASADLTTLLGNGAGAFLSPVMAPSPVQSTPLVANFTGNPTADTVVLNQTGQILFRQGLLNQPGAFAPPVVLNPNPQLAARNLALVQTTAGTPLLAALDANTFAVPGDPTGARWPRVTVYQPHADGSFTSLTDVTLPSSFLPANIASADLNGDGLGDLVITASATDQVFVCLQTAPGVFGSATAYSVGVNPSEIDLVDVNGDGHCDIVVTDRFSGQVSVLLNQGNGAFNPEERFRAGAGPYGLTPVNGAQAVQSLEGTSGVAAGQFDVQPGVDLVVLNTGSDSLSILSGNGSGGFLNPQPALTYLTGVLPTTMVMGHFITGDNNLDLAVLNSGSNTISIYGRDKQEQFSLLSTIDDAGNDPTGIAVADVTRPGGGGPDGSADLLIGNTYGDLLILTGNGDGTFTQYHRADQNVSLAVTASQGASQNTFFFSDRGNDQLTYASATAGAKTVNGATANQISGADIQAPGPESVVSVNGIQYLAVVSSGENKLLIYPLAPDGTPISSLMQSYATGTDPVSLTVTNSTNDLNGDTIPDFAIANHGSNDVSIFLGQLTGGLWTLASRPRQNSGGLGPTSVAIADVPGADGAGTQDGLPDLLVSNGQSNTVNVLPSQGNGFFTTGLSLPTGADPIYVSTTNNGADVVTVNAGSSDVTLIANFMTAPVSTTTATGGTSPVTAVAADVNGDGLSDLLVANAGNGELDLLMGGLNGFEAPESLSQSASLQISDLALLTVDNRIDVYGTESGRETALLLATFTPPITGYIPPGPSSPVGVEIPPSGPVSNNSSSALLVLSRGTFFEGGATLQLVAGLTSDALFGNEPSYPVSGMAEDTVSPETVPGRKAPGAQQPGGGADGILLLNLDEPEDNHNTPPNIDGGQNNRDQKDAEPGAELSKTAGQPLSALRNETPPADAQLVIVRQQPMVHDWALTGSLTLQPLSWIKIGKPENLPESRPAAECAQAEAVQTPSPIGIKQQPATNSESTSSPGEEQPATPTPGASVPASNFGRTPALAAAILSLWCLFPNLASACAGVWRRSRIANNSDEKLPFDCPE